MMKKVIPIVFLLLSLSGCFTTSMSDSKVEKISWDEAISLVRSGSITAVFQAHSLKVWLSDKEGKEYLTLEPEIDEIWIYTKEMEAKGYEITCATE